MEQERKQENQNGHFLDISDGELRDKFLGNEGAFLDYAEMLSLRDLLRELDGRIQNTISCTMMGEWLRAKDQREVVAKLLRHYGGVAK